MSAPTPGPWTIEEYGDDDCPALVIHRDSETRVCFMATPGSHGDPERIEADARLIAAAPEMLGVLERAFPILVRLAEQQRQERGGTMEGPAANTGEYLLYLDARAAIAKATAGGQ